MKISSIQLLLLAALILLGMTGHVFADPPNNPYANPNKYKEGGYNFKDDAAPWFDPRSYPFYSDMADGKSVKPQEEGSYQQFPTDSVPVKRVLGKLVTVYEPFIPFGPQRDVEPMNPVEATAESIENGKFLYQTYCMVCHGADGMSKTKVTDLGIPAFPIAPYLQNKEFGPHLYNKIRYGGFYQDPRGNMPSYGAQTSRQDRWDIVNYMLSPQFGKEE